ncbi:MAG: helix-turn-helix transcriptional regulator, partial [Porphyrobacter sp.]|nr:helix-turn-helix transcriptional regulator [Porphyrobacter sp.]
MGSQSTALPPTIDDTAIWDAWLSQFRLPILNANIEVGTFKALSDEALTTEELAQKLGVDARALAMHLAALSADGYVEKRLGQWRATHLARTWLHPEATGYWAHFLGSIDRNDHLRGRLLESLRTGQRPGNPNERPVNWEAGTMPQEVAENIC